MDRKLIEYLPYVVRDYREFRGITTGEQPEFALAWDTYERALDDQFVDTAGEYGLGRWERMLGITPRATSTLEARRIVVKTRLANFTPYTMRTFLRLLADLADGEPFDAWIEPETYLLHVLVAWTVRGKIESLEWLLGEILPCNIALDARNEISCVSEGPALCAGAVCVVRTFCVTNDSAERFSADGDALTAGGAPHTVLVMLTNDANETFCIQGPRAPAGGAVTVECIEVRAEEKGRVQNG